jgi:hypothetical protein
MAPCTGQSRSGTSCGRSRRTGEAIVVRMGGSRRQHVSLLRITIRSAEWTSYTATAAGWSDDRPEHRRHVPRGRRRQQPGFAGAELPADSGQDGSAVTVTPGTAALINGALHTGTISVGDLDVDGRGERRRSHRGAHGRGDSRKHTLPYLRIFNPQVPSGLFVHCHRGGGGRDDCQTTGGVSRGRRRQQLGVRGAGVTG